MGTLRTLLTYLLFHLLVSAYSQPQDSWNLIAETESVKIYQKDTLSHIKEFITDFSLEGSTTEIEELITNPLNYTEFIIGLDEMVFLHQLNNLEERYLFTMDVGSLFKRSGILRTNKDYSEGFINYTVNTDTTYLYDFEHPKATYFKVYWQLQTVNDNQVDVSLRYSAVTRKYYAFINRIIDRLYAYGFKKLIEDMKMSL